jgi:hypothetical protein
VEAVQAGAEVRVAGQLNDAPGVQILVHVPAPGQCLVGDPDAVAGRELGEGMKVSGGQVVIVGRLG